jgi:hypothetical protein
MGRFDEGLMQATLCRLAKTPQSLDAVWISEVKMMTGRGNNES